MFARFPFVLDVLRTENHSAALLLTVNVALSTIFGGEGRSLPARKLSAVATELVADQAGGFSDEVSVTSLIAVDRSS